MNQGECVEIGMPDATARHVALRDSKNPHGGFLHIDNAAWQSLRSVVSSGQEPTC